MTRVPRSSSWLDHLLPGLSERSWTLDHVQNKTTQPAERMAGWSQKIQGCFLRGHHPDFMAQEQHVREPSHDSSPSRRIGYELPTPHTLFLSFLRRWESRKSLQPGPDALLLVVLLAAPNGCGTLPVRASSAICNPSACSLRKKLARKHGVRKGTTPSLQLAVSLSILGWLFLLILFFSYPGPHFSFHRSFQASSGVFGADVYCIVIYIRPHMGQWQR